MKFLTLKNKEINININPSNYKIKKLEECRSKGQFNLGQLLRQIYGQYSVLLEDFIIPDSGLSLDFYLPHYKLSLEFQGIQHDEYNKFFHKDKIGFELQKKRDSQKNLWCQLNKIRLIEIRNDEISLDELKKLIYE